MKNYFPRIIIAGTVFLFSFCFLQSFSFSAEKHNFPRVDSKIDYLEANANKLDYDRNSGWIKAFGNAVIRKGWDELRADYVRVNINTEEAYAYGNVILKKSDGVWKGDKLHYNFKKKSGITGKFSGNTTPFYLVWEKAEKNMDGTYVFHQAKITTCIKKHPHCHFHIRARKLTMLPSKYLKANGAMWYFGRIPVMYAPYWYRNLKNDFGIRLRPGYTSKMGAFLLSSYRYRINPVLRGETHLDYRTKRGFAIGQDFKWNNTKTGFGDLSFYYADDKKPVDDDEDAETANIDNDRYRIRFKHSHNINKTSYFLSKFDYLSDTDILEDFFEREYKKANQPENYIVYTKRGNKYTANLLVRTRLNDFYSNVNRLPETSLDFIRQQINDTSFYYESETAATFLQKVWANSYTNYEDYSALRIDSSHTVYRPARYFGFLNIIPRAGFRGTYYSKTKNTETTIETNSTTTTSTTVDSGGNTNTVIITTVQTNSVVNEIETASNFRSLFEFGLQLSFKAFKTWDNIDLPLRHIIEPYLDYSLIPEPSLLPERIYQFDNIDTFEKKHQVKLGVRNKLQTKRENHAFDIIDLDVYTIYNLDKKKRKNAIDNIFLDSELRYLDWLKIDMDAIFNVNNNNLDTFNGRFTVSPSKYYTTGMEFRFKDGSSSLLSGDLTFLPSNQWNFNMYGRYEFEDNRLEELSGYVQRNFDCISVRGSLSSLPGYTRSDGSEKNDEIRFMIEFWLRAFPDFNIRGKHKR